MMLYKSPTKQFAKCFGENDKMKMVMILVTLPYLELSGPGMPWVPSMGPDVTPTACANLTDDANRTILQAMWQCKFRHLVAKFATNASGAT